VVEVLLLLAAERVVRQMLGIRDRRLSRKETAYQIHTRAHSKTYTAEMSLSQKGWDRSARVNGL